ncbi:MAG: sigma 54-interacting transcriptional regulator [Desulfatiglandaceae bacterium]
MSSKGKIPGPTADPLKGSGQELRKRAEEKARQNTAQAQKVLMTQSPEETRRILHELRVHQIELEMQNEELRRAQVELEASRERYFNLYDLAPVGYCTVSEKGLILEANLTAATLLNVARGTLVRQPITRFILKEDQDIHYLHRKHLFETAEPQTYELRMVKQGGTSFWVRLDTTAAKDTDGTPVCRVVIIDITEHKRVEEVENALSEIKRKKELLEIERGYLQDEIKLLYNHEKIIGRSDGLKYVLYKVEQIAVTDTNVLVLGETGTGKELVVRAIHSNSLRKNRTLVKVNCAALPPNLIESELFGHEKGSFTSSQARFLGRFEVANGGTLFLDEIGELPLDLQAKLLRVVEDGEFERLGSTETIKVNTRIIVATNRNLEKEVRNGRFREDLWYRINIFPITVPPLRDRIDDIPLLVDFYVKKISIRLGKTIEIIPKSVMSTLQSYHWPGNVRELQNVLERAVLNSSGPTLQLVDGLKKPSRDITASKKTLEEVERDYIVKTLEQTQWKVGGKNSASEILGLNRSTLRARMRKLDINKP